MCWKRLFCFCPSRTSWDHVVPVNGIDQLCGNDRFWNKFFARNPTEIAPVFLLARKSDERWSGILLQSHPGFKTASLHQDIYSGMRGVEWNLTAGQVRGMKDGGKARFFCLDRKFWDMVYPDDDICSPEVMFGKNYIVDFTKVKCGKHPRYIHVEL